MLKEEGLKQITKQEITLINVGKDVGVNNDQGKDTFWKCSKDGKRQLPSQKYTCGKKGKYGSLYYL